MVDSYGSLTKKESCLWLGEHLLTILVEKQIAFLYILENHVDVVVFFESVPESNDVRVADGRLKTDLSLD